MSEWWDAEVCYVEKCETWGIDAPPSLDQMDWLRKAERENDDAILRYAGSDNS